MRPYTLILLVCFMGSPSMVISAERYNGPIIDMHLHANSSIWAEEQICFPKPCRGEPTIAGSAAELRSLTIEAMDTNNIVLGFLSGGHAVILEWAETTPGRFIVSPVVEDPLHTDFGLIRDRLESGLYQGMGEIATQYTGYAPSDTELLPVFELAEEFDLPTHIHTLGIGAPTPTFRVSNGDPRLLEAVLVRHPKLRLFVENCGFPFADEMLAMMYQYPQLHCEISTILHLTPQDPALKYLETLIDSGLEKRIMFGSDQMIWPEVIEVAVEAIQSAEFLTQDQKADIFYNNAARFLRLTEAQIADHHGR